MRAYYPDYWVLIEVKDIDENIIYKTFAGWSGSYTYGESWKLSSGVTKVQLQDGVYTFDQCSGSVYGCMLDREGMSTYMHGVLQNFQEQVKEFGGSMTIINSWDTDFTKLELGL